jgi:hypothetical protein
MNLELIKLLLEAFRKNPHSYYNMDISKYFDYDLNYIGDEINIPWIRQTLVNIITYTDEFNELYKRSDIDKTKEYLPRMRELSPIIGSSVDVLEMSLDNDEWMVSVGLNLPELKINENDTN